MLLQQLEALDKVESVPVKLPTCRCYRFFCMVNQLPVCCCFRSWKPWTRLSGRLSMWTTSNGACLSIRWSLGAAIPEEGTLGRPVSTPVSLLCGGRWRGK